MLSICLENFTEERVKKRKKIAGRRKKIVSRATLMLPEYFHESEGGRTRKREEGKERKGSRDIVARI